MGLMKAAFVFDSDTAVVLKLGVSPTPVCERRLPEVAAPSIVIN